VTYSDSYWVFTGFNRDANNRAGLQGRKLHTDDVPQNGTWHYQASGAKVWHITGGAEPRARGGG